MTIELTVLVGMIGTVIAAIAAIVNMSTRAKKEETANTRWKAELGRDMKYVKEAVDDIRADKKTDDADKAIVKERLTRVEESAKQAHKRIDKLEGKAS
jgi:hypothetical protein